MASYPAAAYPHQDLTREVIGAFYCVYHRFGFGFLESVYRRALAVELTHRGVAIAQEVPFELFHRDTSVGFYRADLIAGGAVIVETKSALTLDPAVAPQTLNYLRAAQLQVGLVLYFGPRPEVKRLISTRGSLHNLTPHLASISESERKVSPSL